MRPQYRYPKTPAGTRSLNDPLRKYDLAALAVSVARINTSYTTNKTIKTKQFGIGLQCTTSTPSEQGSFKYDNYSKTIQHIFTPWYVSVPDAEFGFDIKAQHGS